MLPWSYPVEDFRIVEDGGYKIPSRPSHTGVDVHAPEGTKILAVDDGIVSELGQWEPVGRLQTRTELLSGNYIIISHSNGLQSSYSHLSSVFVKGPGSTVKRGQHIGNSGHTGYVIPTGVEGAHLHFAALKSGVGFIDPMPLFEAESAEEPMAIISQYDEVFAKYADDIPIPFIRTLSYPGNPSLVSSDGQSVGLFQVTPGVREAYNKSHGKSYTREDLLNPEVNSEIAIWLMHMIVNAYLAKHPDTLRAGWDDPRYAGLVIMGYHATYGESSGVGYVVGKMEAQGISADRINIETVSQAAKALGASALLYQPNRMAFIRATLKRYTSQPDYRGNSYTPPPTAPAPEQPTTVSPTPPNELEEGGGGVILGVIAAVLGLFGLGYAYKHRKDPKPTSYYIAQEKRTGKYPHKQAVAIGFSRWRKAGGK